MIDYTHTPSTTTAWSDLWALDLERKYISRNNDAFNTTFYWELDRNNRFVLKGEWKPQPEIRPEIDEAALVQLLAGE